MDGFVRLTRRGLLARAGQLAPLAAAAGMLGRFAVPVAQPIEQAVLPDAVPMQEAMVGWVDAEPVYNQALVAWGDAGGWVARFAGQARAAASLPHPFPILVRTEDGSIYRWAINNAMRVLPEAAARFVPTIRLP
jgi:hypothetical protein